MFKHILIFLTLVFGSITLVSCGNDEPDLPDNDNTTETLPTDTGSQDSDTEDSDKQEENEVTVFSDGTTSTGVPFRRIDDTTFWLNYLKYEIVGGHLEIIGHDCTELEHTLHGEVELFSSVTIDGSTYLVRTIRYNCFHEDEYHKCPVLKKFTMSNTIVDLAYNSYASISSVFEDLPNLEEVVLSNALTTLPNRCFRNCINLKQLEMPNSITSIGSNCFVGCSNLEEVVLSNVLTSLPDRCFGNCENLKQLEMPNSITSIGDNCFDGCSSLEKVELSSNLTEIPSYCFANCRNLKRLEVPNNITWLGYGCLYNTDNLKSLMFYSHIPHLSDYLFYYGSSAIELLVIDENLYWMPKKEEVYIKTINPKEFSSLLASLPLNFIEVFGNKHYFWDAILFMYVPESSVEEYKRYFKQTGYTSIVGYDPETFDFNSLLE